MDKSDEEASNVDGSGTGAAGPPPTLYRWVSTKDGLSFSVPAELLYRDAYGFESPPPPPPEGGALIRKMRDFNVNPRPKKEVPESLRCCALEACDLPVKYRFRGNDMRG